MVLDYQSGQKVIGHYVKLIGQSGHSPNIAMLVEAHPDFAVVKPHRHGKTERVEWRHVIYAKSANNIARACGRARGKR